MRGGPFRPLPVVWAYAQKSIFKRVSKWTNGFSSQSMHTLAVWAKRLEIYRRSWKVRQLHFHKNSKMDLRMFHNISRTCSPKICQMWHIFIIWKYILSRISINPKCEADLSDLGLLSVHIQKRQIQKCFLMNELNSNYGFAIWSCFWIDGGINYLAITMLTFWFTIKIRCHHNMIYYCICNKFSYVGLTF